MTDALDDIAAVLERTGEYRVLRRLNPLVPAPAPPDEPTYLGLVLDTETTGLDPACDEVIELGIVAFTYGQSGRIYRVRHRFNQLHQPGKPIPEAVTRLTGITDADVAGKRIDDAAVAALAAKARVVIAHNARFDRRMCEVRWPFFAELNWACSCHQIDWRDEGHEAARLGGLLADHGRFHNGHRAIDDCEALLWLLAQPLRRSGRLALAALLEAARRPTVRLWASDAPFALKNRLKDRNYRWSSRRRCWYIDLDEAQIEIERSFLSREIYGGSLPGLPADRFTARDRFSRRADPEA
ncbi:Exonuclease RNase T and DNA polymerase III [Methylobacterium sp. 4-46]|uniref:3'-5' exonuclease n=1 Tax=unclassified Methylobacterium TaxID=2615210 RepID=UPI000152D0D1|nr:MULTISPECIES: 3'-5' exonuclease [Methylobacterium]ACA20857.1 Exonuclease RNase T and DNA polymerase III [Methylobacterium sp. 4-46]WFT80012.1 3'-5' exonuclease [Methylobacterium nodulans]